MTSLGCCVLVYNRSGEPVVHCDEPELPRADMSGSEFEVGAPTSEEEVERKKSRVKRAPKSPLTAVPESWHLSILHCRFCHISGSFPFLFQAMSRRFQECPVLRKCRLALRLMGS